MADAPPGPPREEEVDEDAPTPADPRTIRLLRLTTSIDVHGAVPAELRAPALVEARLSEAVCRPVQTVLKVIWPRETMESIIRRWMRLYRPDMVLIVVTPYWFAFESVPLKLERRNQKRGGGWLGRLGKRVAGNRILGNNRLFHSVRSIAHRTVGGVAHYEPDHVIAEVKKYVDVVRETPEVALAVYGLPCSDFSGAGLNRRIVWARARRLEVFRAVELYCAEHNVPSEISEYEIPPEEWRPFREKDGIHITAVGHVRLAEHQLPVLVRAWRQWHPEDPVAAPGA